MKALSVKQKITLWYTGLIVAVLSVIFAAVLFAADDVLLLNLQDKLETRFTETPAALNCGATVPLALTSLIFCMTALCLPFIITTAH